MLEESARNSLSQSQRGLTDLTLSAEVLGSLLRELQVRQLGDVVKHRLAGENCFGLNTHFTNSRNGISSYKYGE